MMKVEHFCPSIKQTITQQQVLKDKVFQFEF